MKERMSYVLDKKDEEVVRLFNELGMPKNLSKALLCISQVEECRSADIEQGTNLRQPEVSVAMQELRRRGWVQKREVKKKGKGRPTHVYKITTDLSNIVNTFEQEKLKEIEALKNNMSELKNIIITKQD
jgi:predicted transcriptional regulator